MVKINGYFASCLYFAQFLWSYVALQVHYSVESGRTVLRHILTVFDIVESDVCQEVFITIHSIQGIVIIIILLDQRLINLLLTANYKIPRIKYFKFVAKLCLELAVFLTLFKRIHYLPVFIYKQTKQITQLFHYFSADTGSLLHDSALLVIRLCQKLLFIMGNRICYTNLK